MRAGVVGDDLRAARGHEIDVARIRDLDRQMQVRDRVQHFVALVGALAAAADRGPCGKRTRIPRRACDWRQAESRRHLHAPVRQAGGLPAAHRRRYVSARRCSSPRSSSRRVGLRSRPRSPPESHSPRRGSWGARATAAHRSPCLRASSARGVRTPIPPSLCPFECALARLPDGGFHAYSIASSSSIIRAITERPIVQKPGSFASRPNGASSSE